MNTNNCFFPNKNRSNTPSLYRAVFSLPLPMKFALTNANSIFPFILFSLFFPIFTDFISLSNPGGLQAAEVIEVPMSPEDANMKIIAVLNKLNPEGFEANEKTQGFIYRYNDTFFSPFDHSIYIGRMSQRSVDSIVRIESGDNGQEKVWRQVLEAELLRNPPPEGARKLEEKSHYASQGLNLLQPSLSVVYNSYDSPLYSFSDTFWASGFYLLADILLVGGAYLYAVDRMPEKSLVDNLLNRSGPGTVMQSPNAGIILGAFAMTRMYRMLGAYRDTQAHNNLVEFDYSFSF